MSEYEFSQKPHRMTSPPANKRQWLVGYEGTKCRLELDPTNIAILCREATWGSVYDFEITQEILESTLKEIQTGRVLGAALEVPALAFVMRGSRCTMDQLLRLRESAGASHTTRDNDMRDFNIIVPNTIEALRHENLVVSDAEMSEDQKEERELYFELREHIDESRRLYGEMVDRGIPPQDARYLCLPMGYQGDWVQVMNLRALIKECEQRLCNGQTQHESDYLVRLQRDLVVEKWPWMDQMLRSKCEKNGQCTQGTMLFPPCGAFGCDSADQSGTYDRAGNNVHHTPPSLRIHHHDPDKHLYLAEANDAMQFADWDWERKQMEQGGHQGSIKFSVPPYVKHYKRDA